MGKHRARGMGSREVILLAQSGREARLKRVLINLKEEGFFKVGKKVILPDHGKTPGLVVSDP